MGKVKEDLQIGVIYPLCCLGISVGAWEYILSKLCQRMDVSEKTMFGVITTTMYILQWSVTNPHSANVIPISPSMDFYLFLSAGYFLRTVNKRENLIQVIYSIVSVISILDIITYRRGGDLAVCYLFLSEFPDILISLLLRFFCFDALIAVADCLLHLILRVAVFAQLVVTLFNRPAVSEDIKMNIFIIHAFSYISIPGIVIEAVGRIMSDKLKFYRRSNLLRCCYTLRRARSRRCSHRAKPRSRN